MLLKISDEFLALRDGKPHALDLKIGDHLLSASTTANAEPNMHLRRRLRPITHSNVDNYIVLRARGRTGHLARLVLVSQKPFGIDNGKELREHRYEFFEISWPRGARVGAKRK